MDKTKRNNNGFNQSAKTPSVAAKEGAALTRVHFTDGDWDISSAGSIQRCVKPLGSGPPWWHQCLPHSKGPVYYPLLQD